MVFKRGVELCDKVGKSFKGERCSRDGALAEGHCSSEGRFFGHVREGEGNLFVIVVIDCLVNEKVELHGVQPVLRFFIRSIKCFGNADA